MGSIRVSSLWGTPPPIGWGTGSSTRLEDHIKDWNATQLEDGSWLHDHGHVYWYNDLGGLHREDGPAITSPLNKYGVVEVWWYLNDSHCPSFDDWLIKVKISDEAKMMLRLQYG